MYNIYSLWLEMKLIGLNADILHVSVHYEPISKE